MNVGKGCLLQLEQGRNPHAKDALASVVREKWITIQFRSRRDSTRWDTTVSNGNSKPPAGQYERCINEARCLKPTGRRFNTRDSEL
jgi:hypothetical protein